MTEDEKWLIFVQQLQNAAQLVNGELSDVFIKRSDGTTSRRFIVELRNDDGGV